MIVVDPGAVQFRTKEGDPIRVIKAPSFPEFRFEYHGKIGRVYLVHVGRKPEIGTVIAFDIDNEGAAQNAVLIWLRGYRAALGHVWDDSGKLIERKDVA